MTPSLWRDIERVYNAALEGPPAERGAFVAAACAAGFLYEGRAATDSIRRLNGMADRR